MNEYYSYTFEESEDTGCSYTFFSHISKRLYSVVFDPFLYQDLLTDFSSLLQNGCALGFYDKLIDDNHRLKFDNAVATTIVKVLGEHLEKIGKEGVLIYHCDTEDGRQKCRHLLFNKWYHKMNSDGNLIKEAVEVVIPFEDGEKEYYLGYITHKENPNIESIKQEFEAFAYFMPSLHSVKNPPADKNGE